MVLKFTESKQTMIFELRLFNHGLFVMGRQNKSPQTWAGGGGNSALCVGTLLARVEPVLTRVGGPYSPGCGEWRRKSERE